MKKSQSEDMSALSLQVDKLPSPRKVKDIPRIIESIKALTYAEKKEVLAALNEAMSKQAVEMKEQAEATLKLIGG